MNLRNYYILCIIFLTVNPVFCQDTFKMKLMADSLFRYDYFQKSAQLFDEIIRIEAQNGIRDSSKLAELYASAGSAYFSAGAYDLAIDRMNLAYQIDSEKVVNNNL